MKPRIIKSAGCFKCKMYLKQLKAQKFEHLIFDADLPENQDQLDKWKINAMPVVQIVDEEDNLKVIYQFAPGRYSPRVISAKVKEKEGEKK